MPSPTRERPAPAPRPRGGERHPVVICGAGPVGLTLAIDLERRGVPTVVLEKDTAYSTGSRAICWAEASLDIWSRLGCAEPILERGVTWEVGRVYYGDQEVYHFDLKPEHDHKHPPFRNLQQYHVEAILAAHLGGLGHRQLRWGHCVTGVARRADGLRLEVTTPDGAYDLEADWLVAADGGNSTVRRVLGLDTEGTVFRQPFLVVDVKVKADFPFERLFWFDPTFHPGRSALLHRQADDVCRVDLQLEDGEDLELERHPERMTERLAAMLGDHPFSVEWTSVYTFKCRRLDRFRHGRVLFVGDAAHQISPFGARGGNCGIQDAANLGWKLAHVVQGRAPEALLDSFCAERTAAADVDLRTAMRSNHFITPQNAVSQTLRDAVLSLSRSRKFARRMVNSGRMSRPMPLLGSPLTTPDSDCFAGPLMPGSPCPNLSLAANGAPAKGLLDVLGPDLSGLYFAPSEDAVAAEDRRALAELARRPWPLSTWIVAAPGTAAEPPVVGDVRGAIWETFDAAPGTFYLLRSDAYVAARWRRFDAALVARAMARATGWPEGEPCRQRGGDGQAP